MKHKKEFATPEFLCPVCGQPTKNAAGRNAHIRYKHSEVWASRKTLTLKDGVAVGNEGGGVVIESKRLTSLRQEYAVLVKRMQEDKLQEEELCRQIENCKTHLRSDVEALLDPVDLDKTPVGWDEKKRSFPDPVKFQSK